MSRVEEALIYSTSRVSYLEVEIRTTEEIEMDRYHKLVLLLALLTCRLSTKIKEGISLEIKRFKVILKKWFQVPIK